MQHGIPLTEEDRRPWLAALRAQIAAWLAQDQWVVLACSALKAWYRRELVIDPARVRMVYLKGSYRLIEERLAERRGHFMRQELLASQFNTLEEPEGVLAVDASLRPPDIVREIRDRLGL